MFDRASSLLGVRVEVLHRRLHVLVAELFLRVMRADLVRPHRRHTVTDGVPREVLILGDWDVTGFADAFEKRVARTGRVRLRLLCQPQGVRAVVLVVAVPFIEPA